MRKRRRILTVAVVMMVLAAAEFATTSLIGAGDYEPMLSRVWRLFLTALLAFFLALGKNYARWIIVTIGSLLSVLGTAGGALFLLFGKLQEENGGQIIALVAFMSIAYAGLATFLAFSPGVSREIRRISEQIKT